MNIALWVVQVLLAGLFGMAGVLKTFQYERAKASLPWVQDVSHGLTTFIGVSELLGAIGLVLPMLTGILPWLTPLAAVGLAVIMLLAIVFHLKRGEMQPVVFTIVLFALAAFVAYGRFVIAPS
jgi:uncharacterized membrane protein YphA (DoxX/SURF4 family)